jgi:hypothetical protein
MISPNCPLSPSTTTAAIAEIETCAKTYAAARAVVAERVGALEEESRAIHRRRLGGIKSALAVAADAQAALAGAVERRPELFAKPRTMTLHGIKLGYQKGKGKLKWADDEKVLAAIKRSYAPAIAAKLIVTTERPAKEALALLPAAELRKLGCEITEAGDFVIIKAADTEVDKLVEKILKEGAVEEVG